MLRKLVRYAEMYNIFIVITSQVQAQPDNFSGNERETSGNVIDHASTYRILLKKAGGDRIARMVDSPYHAYDRTKFSISERGVYLFF